MGTQTAPYQHSNSESTHGFSYAKLEMARRRLEENFDVFAPGLIFGYGDLAGSGTDTIRITNITGNGWSRRFQAMSTETQKPVPVNLTDGTDTITVARYALADEVTTTQQVLGSEPALKLDGLLAQVVPSYLATVRYNLCVAGSGLSSSITNAGSAWTVAKELELIIAATETAGFEGRLMAIRHPEQINDLLASTRSETALQFPNEFLTLGSLRPGDGRSPTFLGVENYQSHDVQQSGSDHVGFAFAPGKFLLGVANTRGIPNVAGQVRNRIDQYGIVMIEEMDGPVIRVTSEAHMGIGTLSDTVVPGWKLISVND